MARITRVRVGRNAGGWYWVPLDPQGRIVKGDGGSEYARKDSAIRGAKRAFGASVRIDVAKA